MVEDFEVAFLTRPPRGANKLLVLVDDGYEVEGPRLYRQFGNQRTDPGPRSPVELDVDGEFLGTLVSMAAVERAHQIVDGVRLPVLTTGKGGLGESQHVLRIVADFTTVEFAWWSVLPDEWSALRPLLDHLESLAKLFETDEPRR
ncbi:MAG TPA: hypothetical protein VM686_29450 [Polyangiaceae bacterium]|nr:hypothetical protein [Polyangiaceae bacterium]